MRRDALERRTGPHLLQAEQGLRRHQRLGRGVGRQVTLGALWIGACTGGAIADIVADPIVDPEHSERPRGPAQGGQIDSGIIDGQSAHGFRGRPVRHLASIAGDRGGGLRDRGRLKACLKPAPGVKAIVGACLRLELYDGVGLGPVRPEQYDQVTIVNAVGVALLQGDRQDGPRKSAIRGVEPEDSGLDHPVPFGVG